MRNPILRSWQRCQDLGLLPDRFELPYEEDLHLQCRLVHSATPVLDRLQKTMSDTRIGVLLTDGSGTVLLRQCSDRSFNTDLDSIDLAPGFRYSERLAGTNGIGTTLAEGVPHHVRGSEHFAECLRKFTCYSAPIYDQLSGQIEGVIDLTCLTPDAHELMDSAVREMAKAIEHGMLETNSQRERSLLRAYLQAKQRGQGVTVPLSEDLSDVEALAWSGVNQRDQEALQEKATELVSWGVRAAVEVALSSGQRVTLTYRPLISPSGIRGGAVEALLPHPLGRRTVVPRSVAPPTAHALPATPSMMPRGVGTLPERTEADGQVRDDEERLVLVGEPAVGKIAVRAQRRLQLLYEASVRVGTTLDVSRTAEELADVAIPRLADVVTVDLLTSALRWEHTGDASGDVRRMALASAKPDCPLYPVGTEFRFKASTPQARCLTSGQSILEPDLSVVPGWLAQNPARAERLLLDHDIRSMMTVLLRSSGTVLGLVTFYRSAEAEPYGNADLSLAEELATRAAVCIDNARRYTREHSMAVALQRSLLPHGIPDQQAVEAAYRYLPAQAGVSGDWFDVIPLSGARVALVVGDVAGRGIQAAATMGRLRTAIQNFAALDLPPDELLSQVDDLVIRLDADALAGSSGEQITGTSCIYAVYDPGSGECSIARAGHLPPAVVAPDGHVTYLEMSAGPPLGLGGLPFETSELTLPPGSQLVFFTDGLLEDHERDIEAGLQHLRHALNSPSRPAEETCRAVLEALPTGGAADDATLLVALTRRLAPEQVATWNLPTDPAFVSTMRGAISRQLTAWGLEHMEFATELILSELVTNAIRHATGPIQVRMLHTTSLICEVSDGSSTSPHLRRAATTDEGGRGLFLVAQLAERWGTRYTTNGKVIWAEQDLSTSDRP
ncbi:SpoIIE family protein phosphatase [Streptomyces sp. TRM72054]|nr:SpoIIE family protein phosphatase [Streptomyces sp. TRM72054]